MHNVFQNFYDVWIPKAQQNVIDLKQTATTLEKSDEHITQLLYVKDSQVKDGPCWNFLNIIYAHLKCNSITFTEYI